MLPLAPYFRSPPCTPPSPYTHLTTSLIQLAPRLTSFGQVTEAAACPKDVSLTGAEDDWAVDEWDGASLAESVSEWEAVPEPPEDEWDMASVAGSEAVSEVSEPWGETDSFSFGPPVEVGHQDGGVGVGGDDLAVTGCREAAAACQPAVAHTTRPSWASMVGKSVKPSLVQTPPQSDSVVLWGKELPKPLGECMLTVHEHANFSPLPMDEAYYSTKSAAARAKHFASLRHGGSARKSSVRLASGKKSHSNRSKG